MKENIAIAHMKVAYIYANLSYCVRRKVGCVIVKHNSIIAIGYNGTPSGEENVCEDINGNTKTNVIHAEDNALRKLTKRTESAENSVMFVTTSPCMLCAPRILDAGIKKVYFVEKYKKDDGIKYLQKKGIEIIQLPIKNFIK